MTRKPGDRFFLYIGVGVTACAAIGYLASLIIPSSESPLENLTIHTFTGQK